jgi:hypothetical protein
MIFKQIRDTEFEVDKNMVRINVILDLNHEYILED